jgi:hypothetical protein
MLFLVIYVVNVANAISDFPLGHTRYYHLHFYCLWLIGPLMSRIPLSGFKLMARILTDC